MGPVYLFRTVSKRLAFLWQSPHWPGGKWIIYLFGLFVYFVTKPCDIPRTSAHFLSIYLFISFVSSGSIATHSSTVRRKEILFLHILPWYTFWKYIFISSLRLLYVHTMYFEHICFPFSPNSSQIHPTSSFNSFNVEFNLCYQRARILVFGINKKNKCENLQTYKT